MDLKILHTPVQMPGFVVFKKKKKTETKTNHSKTWPRHWLPLPCMHFLSHFFFFRIVCLWEVERFLRTTGYLVTPFFILRFCIFFWGGGRGPGAYVVMARSFLCETIAAQAIRWAENYKLTITEWRSIFQKFNCLMGDSIVWIWRLSAHRITT